MKTPQPIQFLTPADNISTLVVTAPAPSGSEAMQMALEIIPPYRAEKILAGNVDNRPIKPRHVKFLADQMLAGAWLVTGDPIKISTTGRLLDGQHRLMAIVQSGTTQQLYVARDCHEEIFSVLDTGRNRIAADVLATAGFKSYALLANAAKLLLMHEKGVLATLGNKLKVATNAAILNYVQTHDLEESARKAANWNVKSRLLTPGEWCALHYLLAKVDPVQAHDFLQQISTGLSLVEGHPVYILRNKLQAAKEGRFNFSAAERMALTIKAWNAHRSGKKVAVLSWRPPGEEFPEIE